MCGFFTGHERERSWNCFETHFFRNKSTCLSSNVGVYLFFILCIITQMNYLNKVMILILHHNFICVYAYLVMHFFSSSWMLISFLVQFNHSFFPNCFYKCFLCRHLTLSTRLLFLPYTTLCSRLLLSWRV